MGRVVIVESPAKAQTINKYLGKDYTVLASYGHIRDLPPRNGSVDPDHGFSMLWEMDPRAQKRVDEIARSLKGADELILATDPDREGEAISWHVYEVLKDKQALKSIQSVKRVVFNEITKNAILRAMDNPREIDNALVDAYRARRALDYLVGFTLSPVLWRKLPGSRSAGRVQSVALRLICERESDIEAFVPQEYWSIETLFQQQTPSPLPFSTHLVAYQGNKLDRLGVTSEAMAADIVSRIEAGEFSVANIENKQVRRNPQPPFITSTLQQEASRKLGFSVTRTMQLAQRLYEGISIDGETVGLITYMRTDGVTLSDDALGMIRQRIQSDFGDKYLPDQVRVYKSKSKNAQEAHEAIRPTDVNRRPESLKAMLEDDQWKLYELIWKRTMACQMENAVLDQASVDISTASKDVTLRATGSVVVFDGFLRLYQESRDESTDGDEDNRRLPKLTVGEPLQRLSVTPEQHFTKPPPRYTEASLVKSMEELGIGRPSTYASIIRILQDRNYVHMDGRRFIPEDRGRLVTTFLTRYFERYVQYNFTADLEDRLDEISADKIDYTTVLKDFWVPFKENIGETQDLTITAVIDTLNEELGAHFFPPREDGSEPRSCPTCKEGTLSIRLGRFGAFIGCSRYPECKYTRQFKAGEGDSASDELLAEGPVKLGQDPKTGKDVTLHKGPYGFYVQLGEEEAVPPDPEKEAKAAAKAAKAKATEAGAKPKKEAKPKKPKTIKPKRAALPKEVSPADLTLDKALGLLTLPRELGVHPQTGETIAAGLGRFGPFIRQGTMFVSLKEGDVLTITLEEALDAVAKSGKKQITLGEYKKKPVVVQKGRFGYYIKYNKLNVALPKGTEPESVTLEDAIARIDSRQDKEKTGKAAPAEKTATTAKKPAAKKAAAKKPAAKKTASKTPEKSKVAT
ncbi:MAG: type I DNA topoisomerase [Candidatus Melainabacteria bacterium]